MSSGELFTNLFVMLVTFFLAAFFVAAEFALVQTRPSALEDAIHSGNGNPKKLNLALKMTQNLNEYLSTTQVGVSVAGIILGWIGESTVETILVDLLGLTHLISNGGLHIISAVAGVLVLTYLEVVFTEIVPKNISIDIPMQMLMAVAKPLHYCHIIFYPFVWLLNISATGVVKLIGFSPAEEGSDVLSQAEIISLSKNAVTGGELDRNDLVYMQRAFDFNDRIAKDVMVDRTSLYVVDITDTVKDVLKDYLQQGFSRFPVVAENDKDKILGYVYAYDLVRQAQVDDSIRVSKLLRSIISVPEATPIHSLLNQMINKQTPIVVVVDEYGGTSGIVTDKDIYEELFGTVKDEIDDVSDEYIIKEDDNRYRVSGKTTLYDFERFFKTKIDAFEASDSVTLAGYVLENFTDLQQSAVIHINQFTLKVVEFNRGYIDWFEVSSEPQNNTANNTIIETY
ncbi:hemolysin family protein [Latilactobacillus curvatus]|uniref:hemolysin family protein n=1 Tax=Latilactobacillus curvatus TaxID=28038 RepID=UPI001C00256E|nr:hemolysin family protein [Latilactobacillus curvatus]QWF35677.1 hemolysin family protein [Latilactobacillus curvatus]